MAKGLPGTATDPTSEIGKIITDGRTVAAYFPENMISPFLPVVRTTAATGFAWPVTGKD